MAMAARAAKELLNTTKEWITAIEGCGGGGAKI
jgi:hypothetical protein